MITGNEPLTPSEVQINEDGTIYKIYVAEHVYLASGITIKQHMVIEFTKAFMGNSNLSDHTNVNETHWQYSVRYAIDVANEVIKQLNEQI